MSWQSQLAAALLLPALLLFIGAASAHDHNRPELDDWYRGLHSSAGTWCCDGSEATRLEDPDWESRDGHYRVKLNGEWVDVPDNAVITQPNKDGRALVWPYFVNGELRGIRCFLPGAGA